jgi:hypothetical protein
MALARADSSLLTPLTIKNADTTALIAQYIALTLAYPERDYGDPSGIKKRDLSDIPGYLLTSIWDCFRHPDTAGYVTDQLQALYRGVKGDEERKEAIFKTVAGKQVLRRYEKPVVGRDWDNCLAATEMVEWRAWKTREV